MILWAIWPNLMIKSSRLSFGDLFSACRGSLCCLSIWRVLTFEIFHHVKTLFMKMAVSFLSALIPERVRTALYVFSKNTLKQVETHCLSMGFEAMEISFKSISLMSLSDSKWYNCLRYAYFATCFTLLLLKISSTVFSLSQKLENIF